MSRSPLVVLGCGMATAVGLTAPASCAAIRGRVDGFQETRFVARGGGWIVGAAVPLEDQRRGIARLACLVASPIQECLGLIPDVNPKTIPLLLGIAEPDRPGRLATLETELLPSLETLLGFRLHAASKLIPMGRVACAVGVQAAARLINMDGYRHVIVAGTDSYLVPSAISSLDGRNRILTERNSNGFIPGEAGAAVLLARDDGTAALRIRSLGAAIEAATIESELPLKGDGLALAYRQALDSAGLGMHEVDFRIADLSGEQYWFKEAALAQARVMRQHRAFQDLWHPADCIGETGAAAAACLMGVVWHAMRKFCAPGPLALAQACNDDGRRIVMILDGTSIN